MRQSFSNIINPYQTTYSFQGQERDDEVKGAGNSVNYTFRMYDPRIGRWFSIDPLADKYPGISPYVFCVNSPIISTDPDGKKVRVMSKDALKVLLSSLSPEDRAKIKVNWRGFVKASSVRAALKKSDSDNLKALYALIKDKRTIDFYSEEKSFKNLIRETDEKTGEVTYREETYEFKAPTRRNVYQELMDKFPGTEEDKVKYGEKLKALGNEDKTESSGNFGATLRPVSMQEEFPGGRAATGDHIEVYINPVGTTDEEKARNVGHELLGHAYTFILGQDPRHGGDGGSRATGNPALENQINKREEESSKNCNTE